MIPTFPKIHIDNSDRIRLDQIKIVLIGTSSETMQQEYDQFKNQLSKWCQFQDEMEEIEYISDSEVQIEFI
jgi:hypothetical protein